jgi:NNP family nitrate/nitrite transporter-like MFS transporter
MITFALFVKMSNGATYAVVPFVNRQALGTVNGIVGAGGNVGAVAAGFLFKTQGLDWHTALLILGAAVTATSFLAFAVAFRPETDQGLHADIGSLRSVRTDSAELVGASS